MSPAVRAALSIYQVWSVVGKSFSSENGVNRISSNAGAGIAANPGRTCVSGGNDPLGDVADTNEPCVTSGDVLVSACLLVDVSGGVADNGGGLNWGG